MIILLLFIIHNIEESIRVCGSEKIGLGLAFGCGPEWERLRIQAYIFRTFSLCDITQEATTPSSIPYAASDDLYHSVCSVSPKPFSSGEQPY